MNYDRWRKKVSMMLSVPDMPLLSPVGDRVEELMRGFYDEKIAPSRVARLFNLRFKMAMVAASIPEEDDGVQESASDPGQP
jgi:hypothetical protein